MRKRYFISAISILGILITFFYVNFKFFNESTNTEESHKDKNCFFASLPITNWTDMLFPTPCVSIKVGDVTISTMIDLGFRGQFSIASEILTQIEQKKYLGTVKRYGYNGKEFEKNVFEIPLIKTDGLTFYEAVVHEHVEDPTHNSSLSTDNKIPPPSEPAKIGWEAFGNCKLLLDLGNEKMAVCDSLATLKKKGYPTESYTKTPLILDRGLLEIDISTPDGPMRCVLDTGCTVNCIHASELAGQTKFDLENVCNFSEFKISEKNFGPIKFMRIHFQLPIEVDACLGMEFFNDNLVFLDFLNHVAYFAPSIKDSNPTILEN